MDFGQYLPVVFWGQQDQNKEMFFGTTILRHKFILRIKRNKNIL
jgi:hypothetical protein